MSNISSERAMKPMKQPDNNLSEAMENLSLTADNSDKVSSSKNLSDMPFDVVGLIIERSDYKEQLVLRNVSKTLRSLVDQQKPACNYLYFYASKNLIPIWFGNQEVVYTLPIDEQTSRKQLFENERFKNSIVVMRDDYLKIALDDLVSTLKKPKLQVETFDFGCDHPKEPEFIEDARKKISKQLKSLNRLFSVKNLTVLGVLDLPTVLPYLKPGVLKTIKICFDREKTQWNYGAALKVMEQIGDLDQWKNAEEFILGVPFEEFPMRYARHFKQFLIIELAISSEFLLRMRDYFSKCVHFESCIINHPSTSINAAMLNGIGEAAPSKELNVCVVHYSIPNSNHYLEFLFTGKKIEIRKKQHSNNN